MPRDGKSKSMDIQSVAHRRRQSQAQVAALTSRLHASSELGSLGWGIEEEDVQYLNASLEAHIAKETVTTMLMKVMEEVTLNP